MPALSESGGEDAASTEKSRRATGKAGRWGKWLGAGAFVFFLVKGLAWLVVPAAALVLAAVTGD